jgi:hypothetical protein
MAEHRACNPEGAGSGPATSAMNTPHIHPTHPNAVAAATAYPRHQLAAAMVTALTHADADTRARAEDRIRDWQRVVDGITSGTLTIGSRTPVGGYPSWVTLDVTRGGFATGAASAGGDLMRHEYELAERAGTTADRGALFAYHLTEQGLAELWSMLDSGDYHVELPEEAALLVVAWLLRAGDAQRAVTLIDTIAPFAGQLRFAPRPGTTAAPGSAVLWRHTVADVRAKLAAKRPNLRVEAQREALTVWGPFADWMLYHWLRTADDDGRVGSDWHTPDSWLTASANLLIAYTRLADTHRLCGKHRDPTSNLGTLVASLRDVVTGTGLTPRQRGRLQCAVDGMVRRRGLPGSAQLRELREQQSAECIRQPPHHAVARLIASRLEDLPADEGIESVDTVLAPVADNTMVQRHGAPDVELPAGTAVPAPIAAVVRQAMAAPVEELVEHGIVPSAEVLAQLVPQITAATGATAFADPALRRLMAANYRAFRRRRSLLLTNLAHQVRLDELPWVEAVGPHADVTTSGRTPAMVTVNRVAELALTEFPATILPNPLVRELYSLTMFAQTRIPLVEELAADIFTGTFTPKFAAAAYTAAQLLDGTLYARYYGMDCRYISEVLAEDAGRWRRGVLGQSDAFAALCAQRANLANAPGPQRLLRGAAANGTIIEQSQILTTHNLAVLVRDAGLRPGCDWAELARRGFDAVLDLVARVHNNPRPLPAIKDVAYGWRQTLFFLSMSGRAVQRGFPQWATKRMATRPGHVTDRMTPVIAGLRLVLDASRRDDENNPEGPLLGWSTRGHWMANRP